MATEYHVRKVCEGTTPTHYFYEMQIEILNENCVCPQHPTATARDFVIEFVIQI